MKHTLRPVSQFGWITFFAGCLLASSACAQPEQRTGAGLAQKVAGLKAPDGFQVSVYADRVPGARSLARSPSGVLFVGTREMGEVYAITGGPDERKTVHRIARGLRMPNGVALRDGSLYVAEIHRILRFDDIENRLDNPPEPVVVNASLPRDMHHGWKFIRFGPDGRLYVPVGAPCNICERDDPRYSTILRMSEDGKQFEVFASGIRNTVGFDWRPGDGVLWFTENGRDGLGDDTPPDELNFAPRSGMHFGFPYIHGREVRDPVYYDRRPKDVEFVPPAQELTPHCAALGMRFYTAEQFPAHYRGAIFFAEHGSWNRYDLPPSGYQVSVARLEGDRVVSYEPFITGFLQGREAWGRPVDVEVMPDGSLLVSDDKAGAIYRVTYTRRSEPNPASRSGKP